MSSRLRRRHVGRITRSRLPSLTQRQGETFAARLSSSKEADWCPTKRAHQSNSEHRTVNPELLHPPARFFLLELRFLEIEHDLKSSHNVIAYSPTIA